jgi:hypothetical protein
MARKSHMFTNTATALVSLAVLAVAMPGGGLARAGEITHASTNADRVQDQGTAVLAGRLIRVADAGSCEHTPPATDATALHAAIERHFAHLARVAAEYRGQDEIAMPQELLSHRDDAEFAAALRDENAMFAERKASVTSQIAVLNQTKELQEREVEFTQAKDAALGRQAALLQKELDNINGLMSKGLAVSSQKLNLEQSVLQIETNRLDLKLLTLKGQQELRKIERSIADLRNQWRNEALGEFTKTQQALATLSQQAQAASAPPAAGKCDEMKDALYVIVRGPGGVMQAFPVAAKDDARGEAGAVMAQNRR